jgi:hypothetical protein
MSQPDPPPVQFAQGEDHPIRRVEFRLWQIMMSAVTLVATVWCFTLNPIVGIIAAFAAKHVLVAILASGLTPLPKSPTSDQS